jgi:hypothetical protein
MYEKYRRHGEVVIVERIAIGGPTFAADSVRLERKPLIEMCAGTRLQAHRDLAELVEKVGRIVEFAPMAIPRDGNEPGPREAE